MRTIKLTLSNDKLVDDTFGFSGHIQGRRTSNVPCATNGLCAQTTSGNKTQLGSEFTFSVPLTHNHNFFKICRKLSSVAAPAKKHPPHGTHLTPTMCVAVSTQSGTHTSTQSCWGSGGGPRGGPWPPPRPPPLTEAVIPVATDSTRHSDQRGGKIGQLLPRIFCLPRASKLAFNFCSASVALW